VAARLLKLALPYFQLGHLILGIDLTVVALSGFVFGSLDNVLLSGIALYISSSVMEAVLYGPNVSWVAYIISDRSDDIIHGIGVELARGATILAGKGGFTGAPKDVVMCAVKRQQIVSLKDMVNALDPGAFVIINKVNEVFGEGFLLYDRRAL
jgi:uncharacterized membrane-anchored protein YitT (DUF2179 family)